MQSWICQDRKAIGMSTGGEQDISTPSGRRYTARDDY
jgi:hypothetical protein